MGGVTLYAVAVVAAVLAVVVGSAVTIWLCTRYERGTTPFAFGMFMLVVTWWSATQLGLLRAETLTWQLLFKQLSYAGVVFTPVTWLVFVVRYIDHQEWLSPARIGLLSVVPVLTLVMVVTIPAHSLFYSSYALGDAGGHPFLVSSNGPWYFVNVVYSYTLLLLGTGLLVNAVFSLNRLYRRQSIALVGLMVVPWLVSGSYLSGLLPTPWIDPTPLAFVAISGPLAVLVVRTDLTALLPVAHQRLFRTLADPILVVNPDGVIVEFNPAAQETLGAGSPLDGKPVTAVLPKELLGESGLDTLTEPVECSISHDSQTRQYLARCRLIDPDRDPGRQGYLLSLTDITIQKDQQQALEHKNRQLERLADVVAHDMTGPLAAAEKTLSLARAEIDDSNQTVERSLENLAGVHDRLRGFADHIPRLARESVEVETTESCDLATLARDAWGTVDTATLDLEVVETTTLHGDSRRLQQVFENLVRNAVEHGTQTSPTESVADRPRGDGGAPSMERATTVRVGTTERGMFIEDDGPGISPPRRDDIFEYGTSTADSSGIGLAIVRTIVEAHGWSITVGESESGGARFEIQTERT